MTLAEFRKAYELVRNIPTDAAKIAGSGNKPEICKHLENALFALQIADCLIADQSDSIMATNRELIKQCEIARNTSNVVKADPKTECMPTPS